ncbi:Putative stress-induced transcription regulator [Streptomyces sp. 1222.2]|nr:Putative stress-induced transcription regulator [Streptomyces sp. 1222.2]
MSGIRLRSYSGNVFRFDPGALCLELLITGGPGALTRYEVLHTPGDLVAWAEQSRLTPTPPPSMSRRTTWRTPAGCATR